MNYENIHFVIAEQRKKHIEKKKYKSYQKRGKQEEEKNWKLRKKSTI